MRADTSEGTLRRIQSLLAYASDDSTPYDAEKQSAMELAEKLMARYGVEQAHLAATGRTTDEIEVRRIPLHSPYAVDRSLLLSGLPGESTTAYRKAWLYGFAQAVYSRLDAVERNAATNTEASSPTDSGTAVVLRDRSDRVAERYAQEFPGSHSVKCTLRGSGQDEGVAAGHRADIGARRVGETRRNIR